MSKNNMFFLFLKTENSSQLANKKASNKYDNSKYPPSKIMNIDKGKIIIEVKILL